MPPKTLLTEIKTLLSRIEATHGVQGPTIIRNVRLILGVVTFFVFGMQ